MKKQLLIYLFCLYSVFIFSQDKEMYLNDDLTKITKLDFETNNKSSKFYTMQFNLDTLIVNVKVQKIKKEKIPLTMLNGIKNELSTLSNTDIPTDNTIVINYYHNLDECNSTVNKTYVKKKYNMFLKQINELKGVSQFFMFKTTTAPQYFGKNIPWIKDESKIIEKTFFPLNYPCGSFLLIDKEGNCYIQKGEYDIQGILKLLKDKNTFKIAS